MAFAGYLIKIGDYTVPLDLIKYSTYQAYINTLDLDPFRDGDGYLHRNTLPHTPSKAEWDTPPITNAELAVLMHGFSQNYTIQNEKTARCTVYIPTLDDYVVDDMYLADIKPTIYSIDEDTNTILYNPIRIAWVGK
jgi:hypothetical protein